jgi:preprotein translocase YajC subunit
MEFFFQALPLLLVWLAWYGLVISPAHKDSLERRAMVKRLVPGDHIMTTLGLRGVVRDMDAKRLFIEVEIAEGVICSMSPASIERILPRPPEVQTTAQESDKA